MTPEHELLALRSLLMGLYIARDKLPYWAAFRLEVWHRYSEKREPCNTSPPRT